MLIVGEQQKFQRQKFPTKSCIRLQLFSQLFDPIKTGVNSCRQCKFWVEMGTPGCEQPGTPPRVTTPAWTRRPRGCCAVSNYPGKIHKLVTWYFHGIHSRAGGTVCYFHFVRVEEASPDWGRVRVSFQHFHSNGVPPA